MAASVELILPAVCDDALADMLRAITKAISERDPDLVSHGLLGGEWGYGAEWNSPVFEMRPFYWGGCTCGAEDREAEWCDAHPHAVDCYRTEMNAATMSAPRDQVDAIRQQLCAKHGVSYPHGCAVHCTCGVTEAYAALDFEHRQDCLMMLPNFLHRASGLEVRFYKYIGRDMEVSGAVDLAGVLAECLGDVKIVLS